MGGQNSEIFERSMATDTNVFNCEYFDTKCLRLLRQFDDVAQRVVCIRVFIVMCIGVQYNTSLSHKV